jgi:hypothetical protein
MSANENVEWWMHVDVPLTNEFKMDMARLEIPVSGWTCLRTRGAKTRQSWMRHDGLSCD